MSTVEVFPATVERWDDVATLLGGRDPRHCWCLYWRLSAGDYNRVPDRPAAMRALLAARPVPGVVGYLDGQPVGWCGFGPRPAMRRLVRSRTIPAVDDQPVWSIVCFVVRTGYRRQGLTHELLDGVISYARAEGVRGLEAYPVDPAGRRIDVGAAHVGTVSLFRAAGFQPVLTTDARSARLPRLLMRRVLCD